MQIATVKYQIATYSGIVEVNCNENDEQEYIIAKAKKMLKQKTGNFPLGYQSFKIINRRNI